MNTRDTLGEPRSHLRDFDLGKLRRRQGDDLS
jgi:hypothetical protein